MKKHIAILSSSKSQVKVVYRLLIKEFSEEFIIKLIDEPEDLSGHMFDHVIVYYADKYKGELTFLTQIKTPLILIFEEKTVFPLKVKNAKQMHNPTLNDLISELRLPSATSDFTP